MVALEANKRQKNVKRDANAFDLLSVSYRYDILDTALLDDSLILSENNQSVVSALENSLLHFLFYMV